MKRFFYLSTAVCIGFSACKKNIQSETGGSNEILPGISSSHHAGKKVHVSNINELYEAVNNPDNAGSLIELAPGTYVLDATYPNGGRLEMLKNMSIQGKAGQANAVVIDASSLPASSFRTPGGTLTGAIRTGNGSNSIEWLKIMGNSMGFASIDTDLPDMTPTIRIANTIVTQGQNGIMIRNRRGEHAGRLLTIYLERNEITRVTSFFGTGLTIQNAFGADNATIKAYLAGNKMDSNRVGLRVYNNAATQNLMNARIIIESRSDAYENNGLGLSVIAGISQGPVQVNNNSVTMEFHAGSIQYNNSSTLPPEMRPLPTDGLPSGIFTIGGASNETDNAANDNQLLLRFWGTRILNNGRFDLDAYGAFARLPATIAGINNSARIFLHGVSSQATVQAISNFPVPGAGNNTVSVEKNN